MATATIVVTYTASVNEADPVVSAVTIDADPLTVAGTSALRKQKAWMAARATQSWMESKGVLAAGYNAGLVSS